MLELGHKERQLLSGLGVQILVVTLLVFAYTQAFRQINFRKQLCNRLQEQLTMAREQVARKGGAKAASAVIQAELDQHRQLLLTPEALSEQVKKIQQLAQEKFRAQEVQVKVSPEPIAHVSVPIPDRPELEANMYALELTGVVETRNLTHLLAAIAQGEGAPLAPLVKMELAAADPKDPGSVRASLEWVVATSASGMGTGLISDKTERLDWGWREEPFLSPLTHRRAIKIPEERLRGFTLSGILWEKGRPTCVINGEVLKVGDWVEGHQLILLTREAALLQGAEEEVALHLS